MFAISSLQDLLARARQSFRTYLPGSDAWTWPNNIYPSAKVVGGMVFEVCGFAAYIARMIFVSTAPDIESLRLHGGDYGLPQLPAAPAGGNVTLTCDDAITVIDGAALQRADGFTYLVTAGGVLTGAGTLTMPVTAEADGAAGNAEDGTPLSIISGVSGPGSANPTASVGPGDIAEGADVEDIESYRARLLFRKRNPPHGGAAADYVMWAQQVSGVSRVFVERLWNGGGTVRVFVFMDGLFPNGIPSPAAVQRVADYIETMMPAGAILTLAAPVAHPIDVAIDNLVPDTTATREAILQELREAILRLGRVAGSDTAHGGMPFLASPAQFPLAWIYQAVANATGVTSFDLSAPAADTALAVGETATLGTVTFV